MIELVEVFPLRFAPGWFGVRCYVNGMMRQWDFFGEATAQLVADRLRGPAKAAP